MPNITPIFFRMVFDQIAPRPKMLCPRICLSPNRTIFFRSQFSQGEYPLTGVVFFPCVLIFVLGTSERLLRPRCKDPAFAPPLYFARVSSAWVSPAYPGTSGETRGEKKIVSGWVSPLPPTRTCGCFASHRRECLHSVFRPINAIFHLRRRGMWEKKIGTGGKPVRSPSSAISGGMRP